MRVRLIRDAPPGAHGRYVLYWMTMYRRAGWNFALERAVRCAERLQRPLVVLEALRCDYPWASERLHRFVLDGMQDNLEAFSRQPALYYPYVEPAPGAGKGLLAALARDACLVVGDDYPAFMLPHMIEAAARQVDCRFELVDSNGLLPLHSTRRTFIRAVDFRRHLQKELAPWLEQMPAADPFAGRKLPAPPALPASVTRRWPAATGDLHSLASGIAFANPVPPASIRGGRVTALRELKAFLDRRLIRYADDRNEPEIDGTSGLSPYLHFGHISAHEIFAALARREQWAVKKLGKATGSKEGWWGMSPAAEAWLDQFVTWRELGFNFCARRPRDYDQYESLPGWARDTLEAHASDPREHVYSAEQLEQAATHDELWNAAQRQMMRDGWFHNYMRMLWGKKILEWSAHPRDALNSMIQLMNKYSLDGRGPNAYSGCFWTLGRYDRPWGPERPIFGMIRYMSSANTARKLSVKHYREKYGADGDAAPGTLL
jgi:deoxyribodipyrimidine photo-lyase